MPAAAGNAWKMMPRMVLTSWALMCCTVDHDGHICGGALLSRTTSDVVSSIVDYIRISAVAER
jgi:hypothetical protein